MPTENESEATAASTPKAINPAVVGNDVSGYAISILFDDDARLPGVRDMAAKKLGTAIVRSVLVNGPMGLFIRESVRDVTATVRAYQLTSQVIRGTPHADAKIVLDAIRTIARAEEGDSMWIEGRNETVVESLSGIAISLGASDAEIEAAAIG